MKYRIILTILTLGIVNFFRFNYLWNRSEYDTIKFFNDKIRNNFSYSFKIVHIGHLLRLGKQEYIFNIDGFGLLTIYKATDELPYNKSELIFDENNHRYDWNTFKMINHIKKWVLIKHDKFNKEKAKFLQETREI